MAVSRTFATPFRVGLVVILGVAAFFVMLSFISRQKYSDKETYRVFATFKDASGLGPKSRVQIAGIEVGIVEKIELDFEAHARASILIRNDIVLREDARITKRSASLLGDFLLDLYPGSTTQPQLKDGDIIGRVVAQPGVEDVFAALGDVTRDIQNVTTSLKDLLASEQGVGSIKQIIQSMNDVAQGLNHTIVTAGGRLDNILADVEVLSGNVRGFASGQQRTIEEILYNARLFTDQANRVMVGINKIVGTSEGELTNSLASVRQTLDQLNQTLKDGSATLTSVRGAVDDTRAVVARVDNGEGTLGMLVRDDGIAKKLNATLLDINSLLKPVTELQTHVNLREELHLGRNGGKTSGKAIVQLRLQPRPDKFYGLELVSDPRGTYKRQTLQRTPDGANGPVSEEVVTLTDDLKFSAFMGKRFGPASLRVGLIESTGGGGMDLHLLEDKLKITVDAFDFANAGGARPRLRTAAQMTFFDHLYVGAGVDDVLNYDRHANFPQGGATRMGLDAFVTGGLQFNDEDLKGLLTVTGVPAP